MLTINRGVFFYARLRADFQVPRKIEFCSSDIRINIRRRKITWWTKGKDWSFRNPESSLKYIMVLVHERIKPETVWKSKTITLVRAQVFIYLFI